MSTFGDLNLLNCVNCKLDALEIDLNADSAVSCPHCNRTVAVHLFPALVQDRSGDQLESRPIIGNESSCYYHSNKTAEAICDGCGRFLCSLCEIEVPEGSSCASCIAKDLGSEQRAGKTNRFIRHDSTALMVAVLGIPFFFVSFITSTMSLYYVVRYWRTPLGYLPRSRWRFVVAGLISLGILSLWAFFIVGLVSEIRL